MNTVIKIINIARMALFGLGYGLLGALIGGTLNRVMVTEYGLPIALVGIFFAADLVIAPLRTWIGYQTDAFPILNRRREPYMLIGALLASLGAVLVVLLLTGLTLNIWILGGSILLAFMLHEFGRNLGHNSFMSLIADRFSGKSRSQAITLYEIATILGLVIGAGFIASRLRDYSESALLAIGIAVPLISFVLSTIAALGNEPVTEALPSQVQQARSRSFGAVLRQLIFGDRQVRMFFLLILFTVIGTLAQDLLLEPYGGIVLGMSIEDTSRLTQFWGLGVLAGMLLSGVILIRLVGHLNVLRAGLVSALLMFVGIIVAGILGNVSLFNNLIFVMGFGTGLAGAGLLSTVVQFTTPARTGLLMGVWGLAMVYGRSLGALMSGFLVQIGLGLTGGNAFAAYGTVFALEAIMLVIALILTTRVHIEATQASQELAIGSAD